jgi:dCMP deaminase
MHCAILGIEAGIAGAILYTTFVPCLECTKMAITIGIKKFVCLDSYPETDFELLKEAGVEVIQLDKKRISRWAKDLVSKYENSN